MRLGGEEKDRRREWALKAPQEKMSNPLLSSGVAPAG